MLPIVITGPTASGKSQYVLKLALQIDGEIICADSRQIYQRMSIGTACPSPENYKQVLHHGFERLNPKESYSAGDFIRDTDSYVQEISSRKKTPILVGGTGLYLRSWRFGLEDVGRANPQIRTHLEQESLENLHAQLKERDPASAAQIKPTDSVRIKRALEIYASTGKIASQLRQTNWQQSPRVQARWLCMQIDRDKLDKRLQTRVHSMFEKGLVQEAQRLRDYLGPTHALLKTPGYLEALQYAEGQISKEQAIELVFRRHRQYAKRQVTWFQKENWWEILNPIF